MLPLWSDIFPGMSLIMSTIKKDNTPYPAWSQIATHWLWQKRNSCYGVSYIIFLNNLLLNIKSQYITDISYSIHWMPFKLMGSEFCSDLKILDKGYLIVLGNNTKYIIWKTGSCPWIGKIMRMTVALKEVQLCCCCWWWWW